MYVFTQFSNLGGLFRHRIVTQPGIFFLGGGGGGGGGVGGWPQGQGFCSDLH